MRLSVASLGLEKMFPLKQIQENPRNLPKIVIVKAEKSNLVVMIKIAAGSDHWFWKLDFYENKSNSVELLVNCNCSN